MGVWGGGCIEVIEKEYKEGGEEGGEGRKKKGKGT